MRMVLWVPSSTRMTASRPTHRFTLDVPAEMLEAMTGGGAIAPRISRAEALQVPAVLRSRNLICGTLGSLPHTVYDPRRVEVPTTYLLGGNIDPNVPNSVVLAQTYEDLFFEGVAWWKVTKFGWHRFPVEATHIPWQAVHVAPTGGLTSVDQISPDLPYPVDGDVYIDGVKAEDNEIIRFDSPNPPLLTHAARAIRTCLLLNRLSGVYADNPRPLDYFSPAEGADPADDDEIEAILDDWRRARKERSTAYVPAALRYNSVEVPTPADLQLVEMESTAILNIARAAGIDPEDLGLSTTSRTYQNSEQRRQDLLDFTLGAYVSAMQDRLSMRDVVPRGYKARVKFTGFLRSDTKTRMETYQIGREVGAYADDDEIRELEDRPALSPAQRAARKAEAAPEPKLAAPPAASREPELTFSAPAALLYIRSTRPAARMHLPGKHDQKSHGRKKNLLGKLDISKIVASVQQQIFASYKAQPHGQLLSSPTHASYDNLVAVAHVHGKDVPGGLSPGQVAAVVDEQLAQHQNLTNQHLLEQKVKDWLGTADGATYAKAHTKPDPAIVGGLTGKVDLPEGVKLKPGQKVQVLAGPGRYKAADKDFPELTAEQAQAMQDQVDAVSNLTKQQYHALSNYTGGGYSGMNDYLRGKSTDASPMIKAQVVHVQSSMTPLTSNVLLKRGTEWDQMPEGFRDPVSAKLLLGKTIQDPGFMSTALAGTGGEFPGTIELTIEAPAGTPGRFVKKISLHPSENELLLAAATKLRVLSMVTEATSFGYSVTKMRLRVVTPK